LRKREKEVELIVEEWKKMKRQGKSDRHFIVGREKEHSFLEVFQASFSRPSDKDSVKVNIL
jgi:hypothetical protein